MSSDVTPSADTRASGGITTATTTTDAHHTPELNASVCPSPDVAARPNEKPKEISDLPPDILATIMGYLPKVSDRFRLASVSQYFRNALRSADEGDAHHRQGPRAEDFKGEQEA